MSLRSRPNPHDPIRASDIDALWRAIDECQVNVGPGSGLGMHRSPSGTDLWAFKYSFGVLIGKTTTIIGPASGATLGTGSGQIEQGTGTAITDPSGTPPTVTFYSNDTKTVALGAYVVVVPFRDGFMVIHARCANLS
jgi:hypothetical protein